MGCLRSKPVPPPSQFDFEGEEIATISYRKTNEKVSNIGSRSHATNGSSFWMRRKTKIKKHHRDRLTPSMMNLDMVGQEEDLTGWGSYSSVNITAITDNEKHWKFPKWGHHKKCTFCGCECHDRVAKAIEKGAVFKQNNFRSVQITGVEPGGCAMAFANLLAMNALDLTAPASSALLKNRKNAWVQLAGHPGSFAPAGPHTIWKKRMTKENNETVAYQSLMNDNVKDLVPQFYREVEYNGDFFIEIEDLLQHFHDPSIMDIKMGTRTFLESEVKNPVLRKDLYQKMVKLSPAEPTPKEHEEGAITKLRYMQFREKGSSTATLGFRIEAIRLSGETPITDLKKLKSRDEVKRTIAGFLNGNQEARHKLVERFKEINAKFSLSTFFKNHEIIGGSILIMYDKEANANAWMIDFAKTFPVEVMRPLSHRARWEVGTHEDGYLYGLDNLIDIFEDVDLTEVKNTNVTRVQALAKVDNTEKT